MSKASTKLTTAHAIYISTTPTTILLLVIKIPPSTTLLTQTITILQTSIRIANTIPQLMKKSQF
jgi:hypothetical protein